MASTYNELKKGATGNNVSALQTALNNNGYSLTSSGVYDDATEAAVKQYQTDNNLSVDGVAGNETLGTLYKTNNSSNTVNTFTPSASVTEAQKYLDSISANRPGAYQSKYNDQISSILDQINNRGTFQYDATNDPLYEIYKDNYMLNGKRAMQDTIGQTAALTGGYGNSYATNAGYNAYQQYLEGLNGIVPELQQNAYTQWQNEGNDLMNRYSLMQNADDTAYNRNADQYNRWNTELQQAQSAYDNAWNRDYQQWATNQNTSYNMAMNLIQTGQVPDARTLSQAGISQADAEALANYYKNARSGSGGGGDINPNPDDTQGKKSRLLIDVVNEGVKNITSNLGSAAKFATYGEGGLNYYEDVTANLIENDVKNGTMSKKVATYVISAIQRDIESVRNKSTTTNKTSSGTGFFSIGTKTTK